MKKLIATLGAGVLGISSAFAVQNIVTFSSLRTSFNNGYSYTLGIEFAVTTPIAVVGLSAFTANPAAGLNENTPVGLWDASQNELASATVLSGTTDPLTPDGFFRYATLSTPLTLPAGIYHVGAEFEGGVDNYTINPSGLATISGVTLLQAEYNLGTSLTFPGTPEARDVLAVFGGNVVVVPEPTTWSLLALGIGAVVGGRILRRRSS